MFAYGSESITNQAFWLGFAEMFATYEWFLTYLDRLAAVTPEEVQRIAQTYLRPQNRVVGTYLPIGNDGNLGISGGGATTDAQIIAYSPLLGVQGRTGSPLNPHAPFSPQKMGREGGGNRKLGCFGPLCGPKHPNFRVFPLPPVGGRGQGMGVSVPELLGGVRGGINM